MIKCKKWQTEKYSTDPYIYQNYAKLNNVYLKEIDDTWEKCVKELLIQFMIHFYFM